MNSKHRLILLVYQIYLFRFGWRHVCTKWNFCTASLLYRRSCKSVPSCESYAVQNCPFVQKCPIVQNWPFVRKWTFVKKWYREKCLVVLKLRSCKSVPTWKLTTVQKWHCVKKSFHSKMTKPEPDPDPKYFKFYVVSLKKELIKFNYYNTVNK